jgi:hypothetical protein
MMILISFVAAYLVFAATDRPGFGRGAAHKHVGTYDALLRSPASRGNHRARGIRGLRCGHLENARAERSPHGIQLRWPVRTQRQVMQRRLFRTCRRLSF